MKTDEILRQDVSNALQSNPMIAPTCFQVLANSGAITLTGAVDNYSIKSEAEAIAKEVAGVQSVINMIDVRFNSWEEKKDFDITREILKTFRWNRNTLNDTIKVEVISGQVTLSGELEWNYQKEAASEVVTNLIGVKGVNNNIIIKSQFDIEIDKTKLKLAMQNHLALDSKDIEIEVLHSNITLKGTVDSWHQKELAGRIAWKALGVINVDNELLIETE